MKMISEIFIKQKTWFNFVSFFTEQSLELKKRDYVKISLYKSRDEQWANKYEQNILMNNN